MSEDFPTIPLEGQQQGQPEERVWQNPDMQHSEEVQAETAQDTRDTSEEDIVKAQLVATAVNDQMQTTEAIQLSEAKYKTNEFERYANDKTLPVRRYGIRNDSYEKYKTQYKDAAREPNVGVKGVQKARFSALDRLRMRNAAGENLEDPYQSNSGIEYAEERVVESEAKLAEMPIGPWKTLKGRYGNDAQFFAPKDMGAAGSEEYAKFARQRSETYAQIAKMNDEIAEAEQEQADPALTDGQRRRLSSHIAGRKAAIAELEGIDTYRGDVNPLGYIDRQEQAERSSLSRNRQELAQHYAGGAEYYRAVSERLNDNLNNVAQQFEDFYDLAPETFSGKSSKEFLDTAKEYFGLKEQVRQAEFAAGHATNLLGTYEWYIEALEHDSDKDISANDISIYNLEDKIRYYFGASQRGWESFDRDVEGLDGEALERTIESHYGYELGDGINALATTENLASYVAATRKIAAEWLDSSPRQTLQKFQAFAKELQEKQQAELRQKQDELNSFVASLKGEQVENTDPADSNN